MSTPACIATVWLPLTPATSAHCADGAIRIQRLLPAEQPLPRINLFDTIPTEWIRGSNPDLVARAAELWEALPRPLAHLFNAVLWKADRFHRYVMVPSSLNNHHTDWNDNFRHSIEVAERARDISVGTPLANVPLLIAAGLLHDAGKADEYRFDEARCHLVLSERGELIGHRNTLIEWLGVARDAGRVLMPESLYLALLHTLSASKAPAWVGLRDPRCIEAEILSMADRMSGHEDLHAQCAPADGKAGFGRYHKHIGHRTYVTPRTAP